MLNALEYYELCMQGFAALKRDVAEAEQYTVQLYNNQVQAEQSQMQAQESTNEVVDEIVEEKVEEKKNVHNSKKQDN